MLIFFLFFYYNFYRSPLNLDYEKLMNSDNERYWVLFTDKGFFTEKEYKNILKKFDCKFHPKTIERRLNTLGKISDFYDLPVYEKYIEELRNLGIKIRYISNWINGVSCEIPKKVLPSLRNLPFIYDIRPLKSTTFPVPKSMKLEKENKDTSFYGYSYRQIAMLGVDKVHKKGIYGSGVKIGLLDTGLRRKRKNSDDTTVNRAVEGIKVIKEHDFLAGGDFFLVKKSKGFQKESIPNLKNFRMIENPKIDYLFNINGEKLPLLFFITDTQYLGMPKRTLLYTYYEKDNWRPTKSISYYLTPIVFHNFSLTNNQTNMTFITFDGSETYEKNKEIYFGYFYYTNFQNSVKIENGSQPYLFYSDSKLYLAFIYKDSILKIKKANITPSEIVWQETKTVHSFNQRIKKPIILFKDSLNYCIFCLSKEGKIYYLKTNDGENYRLDSLNSFSNVSDFKIKNNKDTIYLLVKEYENSPLINLVYSYSTDFGERWKEKEVILRDKSFLGNFDFLIKNKIYLTYEIESNIYLLDFGSIFNDTLFKDTNEFHYNPILFEFNNDIWLVYNSQGDDDTDYEEGEDFKEQPYHGTRMASLIAGYAPRYLIGVAPAVEFLIAKTEEYKYKTGEYYEYIIEEDNWVKGLEWCEKNGAQIISSSLGYRGWYEDSMFDGKTAITSLAANIAAQRGLIIVTAMGNRGSDSLRYPWPQPYLVAPGDAEGVLTIGGVMPDSSCWRGSGAGPTAKYGKIKPDLVALAYNAVVAKPDEDGAFEYSIGTSSATALVAGLCALILEVHPNWKIEEVREALFKTASESIPSCTLGYGIPNIDSLLKIYPGKIISYQEDEIGDVYPQPFIKKTDNEKIYFPLRLKNPSRWANLKIYNLKGKLIFEKELNTKKLTTPGRYEKKEILEEIGAYWEGKDKKGKLVAPGLYFVVLETGFNRSIKKFTIFH